MKRTHNVGSATPASDLRRYIIGALLGERKERYFADAVADMTVAIDKGEDSGGPGVPHALYAIAYRAGVAGEEMHGAVSRARELYAAFKESLGLSPSEQLTYAHIKAARMRS